jgi:DNA-binding CsgD family transcriptional regulator
MDRAWLETELGRGRSLESLAREARRPPSTVAYWASKYGLRSAHADRHAPRGAIDRATLERLVAEGGSTRAIAATLGRSQATVRHWLARYGLATRRGRALSRTAAARRSGLDEVTADCPRHGPTTFVRRPDGGLRCLQCRADAVAARRRRVKAALVEAAGGACRLCGYDRSPVALQFHHVDPGGKAFAIADRGVTRSLAAASAEAAKCVLLCANCHAEVEAGLATLPPDPPARG